MSEKKEGRILSDTDFSLERRKLLGALAGCSGVLLLSQLGYGVFSFLNSKPVGEKKPVKMNLSDLPMDKRVKVIYGGQPVEVIRTNEGIQAISLVCTHLGCLVIWESEKNVYHCPCHDAQFDKNGKVLAGPPPMPLEKLKVDVSGSEVTIGGL
jgi:cytochrome b6-f complex iron-sulfur subunit